MCLTSVCLLSEKGVLLVRVTQAGSFRYQTKCLSLQCSAQDTTDKIDQQLSAQQDIQGVQNILQPHPDDSSPVYARIVSNEWKELR